jgi:hypothetical protein
VLALAVYTTRTSGVPTGVLVYAFVFDYVFRLITIRTLYVWLKGPRDDGFRSAALFLSRPPSAGHQSEPLVNESTGRPLGLAGYLAVVALLFFFVFVLANVNADRELAVDFATAADDLNWAVLIGAIYWVNGLLTRSIVIRPDQSFVKNLGYNTREVTWLAVAVLIGGAVVAFRQTLGLPESAWTVMGPLLVLRTITDLVARLRQSSPREAAIANLSPRVP